MNPTHPTPNSTHPFRLILLDLDGTTLRPDATLSERTVDAIRRTVEAGAQVVLASARPPRSMRSYQQELRLSGPMIAYNGALVVDGSGKVLFRQNLEGDVARKVVSLLRDKYPTANISLECDDRWHIDFVDEDLRNALVQFRVDPPHSEGQVNTMLFEDGPPVTKILFPAGDAVRTLAAEFQEAFGQRACFIPTGDLVEIVAEGVSKGAAAAWLCTHMGIAPEFTAAFGNDYNDIPLLEFASLAVAMDNSPEGVKQVAHQIAPTNSDDGVAVVLEEMLRG